MELATISTHAASIRSLFEGLLETDLDHALKRMISAEQWEALAILSITANEVPARRIISQLLAHERFTELVLPACFRRQVRKDLKRLARLTSERMFV